MNPMKPPPPCTSPYPSILEEETHFPRNLVPSVKGTAARILSKLDNSETSASAQVPPRRFPQTP